MAANVVKEIKEAEAKAAELLTAAQESAAQAVRQAEADREANIAAAVAGAREEARLMVEEASRAADAASDKRREDNTLSIAVMKARAKEKRPQAVRYILENLAES